MSRRITVSNGETPIYDIVLETSFDGLAEEVEKIRQQKADKRGGFEKKILLEEVRIV